MNTTTLVVFGESALGTSLKQVNFLESGVSIVEKPATRTFLAGQAIATNLGASFLYCEKVSDFPPTASMSSFTTFVCIVNVHKLSATATEKTSPLSMIQSRAPRNTLFCVAYNADEAAEFVLSLVAKLGNPHVREQAAQMAAQSAVTTTDYVSKAFEICEQGFPISARETRALLESAGSIRELCDMKDSTEIAARSPLSNRDAIAVAKLLGLPIANNKPPTAMNMDNIRRFF